MEAAVYKKREGGNIAALFSSDGSLNMAEFCEKISKRFVQCLTNLFSLSIGPSACLRARLAESA